MRTIRRSIWCTLVLAVTALVFTAAAVMQHVPWTEAAEGGPARAALSNPALERAAKMLPTLRKHPETIRQVEMNLGRSSPGNATG